MTITSYWKSCAETMMDPKTKIAELERTLQQLIESVKLLNQRVNFLERENTRRKSDVTQISSAIKK